MCGRYVLRKTLSELRRFFDLEGDGADAPPRYNIAPTQLVSVVRLVEGKRRHSLLLWGLIPHWSKGPAERPLINARADTIAEKPSFREAFRKRRCLILSDGFYEWQPREGKQPSQPFFIRRPGDLPFAMAGIWEQWVSPDSEIVESVAIVTTDANEALSHIHHRMPVILDSADYDMWMDATKHSTEDVRHLLRPAPNDLLEAIPIGTRVNTASNDGPDLLKQGTVQDEPPKPAPAPKRPKPKPTDEGQGSLF